MFGLHRQLNAICEVFTENLTHSTISSIIYSHLQDYTIYCVLSIRGSQDYVVFFTFFRSGFPVILPAVDTVCYILSMLCVGFLEEVIFRGFLFRALAKENVNKAIIITSVTFGLGHILNLFNGSGMDCSKAKHRDARESNRLDLSSPDSFYLPSQILAGAVQNQFY